MGWGSGCRWQVWLTFTGGNTPSRPTASASQPLVSPLQGYPLNIGASGSVLAMQVTAQHWCSEDERGRLQLDAARWADASDAQRAAAPLLLRSFTPREVANLQGFPPEPAFSFPPESTWRQRWRLLGNSLSIDVVAVLMAQLLQGVEAQLLAAPARVHTPDGLSHAAASVSAVTHTA